MFKYQGININYKDYGNKEGKVIIYLHGWGQNIQMMEPIANPLKNTHHLIIFDLPGFGESDEPTTSWTLDEYVEMIHTFIEEKDLKNINLIGHSFGGKLSLLYASKYEVNKLMLLASPYKVKITKPTLKQKMLKKAKEIPGLKNIAEKMKNHIGSTDYKNASPIMKEVLVKHVNTDLTETAKKIKCPTFIIWGTNDEAVPISDAYELEKLIKDSGLSVYEGCTHYAYLERLGQTNAIIASFMK